MAKGTMSCDQTADVCQCLCFIVWCIVENHRRVLLWEPFEEERAENHEVLVRLCHRVRPWGSAPCLPGPLSPHEMRDGQYEMRDGRHDLWGPLQLTDSIRTSGVYCDCIVRIYDRLFLAIFLPCVNLEYTNHKRWEFFYVLFSEKGGVRVFYIHTALCSFKEISVFYIVVTNPIGTVRGHSNSEFWTHRNACGVTLLSFFFWH